MNRGDMSHELKPVLSNAMVCRLHANREVPGREGGTERGREVTKREGARERERVWMRFESRGVR